MVEDLPVDLARVYLALVGGHLDVRRVMIDELRNEYGLKSYVEVSPTREENVDRPGVQARLDGADLIGVIIGYSGHDLTNIVRAMKEDKELSGHVCGCGHAARVA